jgi:hypothetical protein
MSRGSIPWLALAVALAAEAAHAYEVRALELFANELVYEPVSGLLYASLPSAAGAAGNSVVPIDPETGSIGTPVFVGSELTALATSEDGSALYVALGGAYAIRRVDLGTQLAGAQFALGDDPVLGPYGAEDIEVLPGSSDAIAVALTRSAIPRHGGVAVFDGGVRRALTTAAHTGANRIEFSSDPALLYGYNDQSTEFGFRRIRVDAQGATELDVTRSLIKGFDIEIDHAAGRVYAGSGRVIDPEQLQVDDAGCSRAQFCGQQGAFCKGADWGNDEPGQKPRDCQVVPRSSQPCEPR